MVDERATRGSDGAEQRAERDADESMETFTRLAEHWRPEPFEAIDTLTALPARALAALFDVAAPVGDPGDPLPPLWHWLAFPSVPAQSELGDDGHPRDAALTPPIPNRRRMFGGGRLTLVHDLRVGDTVVRRSEVVDRRVRKGRTGPLLIVTVGHTFAVGGRICAHEEQDLVYLSAAPEQPDDARSSATTRHHSAGDAPEAPAAGSAATELTASGAAVTLQTSQVLLFRFSALTWNSHRIHYDQAYTTDIEGHPALVVHGPLLALLLLEVPRRLHPDRRIASFAFRARRPVYVGSTVEVHERPWAEDRPPDAVGDGSGDTRGTITGLELVASSPRSPEAMVGTVEWVR